MYKKIVPAILVILMFASVALAEDHCGNCGMNVNAGSKSTITLKMNDGTAKQLCSLYCYSRLKERDGGAIKDVTVKDYVTGEELSVESAVWADGSDAPEPMGDKSHVAFKDHSAAVVFVRKHGGKVASFNEAYKDTLSEWKH